MADIRLTIAFWDYDRVRPLIDRTIKPNGIDLNPIISRPSETFYRMLRHQEFDVSELSLSNYTMLRSRGDDTFVAIPVFPSRLFRHSCIYVNRNAGINKPDDLIGRRVGVPEYSMTAAVFARGLLLHEYGVKPETIEWFSGTQDGLQRPTRIDFELPGVKLTRMPLEQDMGPMLETGEIDAIISPNAPKALARTDSPVRRLFEDYRTVEKNYFAKTGIFPIMHTIVLRKDIYEKHPWAAASLVDAFEQAKAWAYDQLGRHAASWAKISGRMAWTRIDARLERCRNICTAALGDARRADLRALRSMTPSEHVLDPELEDPRRARLGRDLAEVASV